MDGTITIGAIGTILSVFGVGGGLMAQLRKNRREDEADRKAGNNEIKAEFSVMQTGLTERIVKLEGKVTDFMPRSEIEYKIEHEKNNRSQADEALRNITDRLSTDVRTMMVSQSKMEQQQSATSTAIAEIKDGIKELSKEIGARFDKVSTAISGLTAGHRVRGEIDH